MFSIKNISFLLFIIIIIPYNGQNQSVEKLAEITKSYESKGDLIGALEFNLKALNGYEAEDNIQGQVAVCITIGNLLWALNKHDESLHYLDKAKKNINKINNPISKSRLYNGYGRNYSSLGLYKQSNYNFNKAISEIKKSKDKKKDHYLNNSYSWKWYNFEMLKEDDSVYEMQKKSIAIMPNSSLIYSKIADRFIVEKKHLDSAEYYLTKAIVLTKNNVNHEKATALYLFGDLYAEKGKYNEALQYYFQALDIFQKIKKKTDIRKTYEKVSNIYRILHENEKAEEYFMKFTVLNDTIHSEEKKVVAKTVEKILHDKTKEEESKRYVIIAIISSISIILIFIIRKKYIKKQKTKDELIMQQSIETDSLKVKINDSFDEVILLAKKGDPFFITKFKEVYRDFCDKLFAHTPDLTDHDLRICAYIKLSLTNKEISRVENITVRAIQTKRYRLKKKLNLPADIDLVKWIIEL